MQEALLVGTGDSYRLKNNLFHEEVKLLILQVEKRQLTKVQKKKAGHQPYPKSQNRIIESEFGQELRNRESNRVPYMVNRDLVGKIGYSGQNSPQNCKECPWA